jgi:hypothetical protein
MPDPAPPPEAAVLRQSGRSRRFGLYLAITLLLPLLAFVSIFAAARTGIFIRTSKRQFWHSMEYQFADRPKPCDVLIFGDSTGLMGVDPRILEARTGWSACNFAIPYLGMTTTGNLTLDHYLASHKAPRFLVIEVHPSHLRPPTLDDESGIIDGFLLADRKLPPLAAAKFFLSHPKDSFYFGAQLWKDLISFTPSTSPDFSENTYNRDMAQLAAADGFFTTGSPGGNTDCFYQFHAPTFSRRYLQGFDKYAINGTTVVFWPSPVRHCDVHLADYRLGARFLGVPEPLLLEDTAFVDAQHLSAQGVEQNTDALADALLQRSKQE